MTKAKYIVFIGALLLTGCATTNVAPLDDAYYWPDKNVETTATAKTTQPSSPSQPSQTSSPSSSSSTSEPKIVYTSVQDTAVTIRIKR